MGAPSYKNKHNAGRTVIVPAATTNATSGFIGVMAAIVASIGAGYDDGATSYQQLVGAPKRPI